MKGEVHATRIIITWPSTPVDDYKRFIAAARFEAELYGRLSLAHSCRTSPFYLGNTVVIYSFHVSWLLILTFWPVQLTRYVGSPFIIGSGSRSLLLMYIALSRQCPEYIKHAVSPVDCRQWSSSTSGDYFAVPSNCEIWRRIWYALAYWISKLDGSYSCTIIVYFVSLWFELCSCSLVVK